MTETQAEKVQIAVFDFDGTSIEGSSPSWLVNRLIFTLKISPITSLKIGCWGVAYKLHLPQNESWVRGQVFRAFAGKPKREVDQYLRNFYDEWIAHRFRPEAERAMRKCTEKGCEVVVVSATFEPIVLRAMEEHSFQHQISTRMKVAEDGTYTREVDGLPIEGDAKIVALIHWCDGRFGEGNWELAYAYGDHHSDEPLLAAAKHPFAVSPNSGMRRIAEKRGWPILDWEIDVPKR
ncbi:MAG TPA: HAD-IB family hydrolase [Eggerthellaceae bacterium]|nr:HAD-IB family hydrolase [Eggerthellaceae bacterium]